MGIKNKDINLTEGVIWQQLVSYSLPLLLGFFVQQLYNTVDSIVVGNFVGSQALAAVGTTGSIINMVVGFSAGLATGASVVIARNFGAGDWEALHRAVQTTVALSFALSVLSTVAGVCLVPALLRFMDSPADVFPEAQLYLTIYFWGVSAVLIYNMGTGVLRAVGDTRRPLYFLCSSAILNVILDILFVVVFRWGIAGAAWATVIAQASSAALVLFVLTKTDAIYRLVWKGLRPDWPILRQIFTIGLPAAIQQVLTAFSNVFVQSYVNAFGSACMAGWSACSKLDQFIWLPMQSISMAATTFVSQNFGAKNYKRARRGVNVSIGMSVGLTAAISVVVLMFPEPLLRLFNQEEEILAYGQYFMRILVPFYALCCLNQVYAASLRGMGNSRAPMLIMLGSFVVFRQIFLYVSTRLGGGLLAVALGYPMGWVVCSVLLAIYYYHYCRVFDRRIRQQGPQTA